MYAAVLRHHLSSADQGTDKARRWPAVYVLDRAVKNAADPDRSVDDADGATIPADVRREVVRELADVAAVRFISDRDAVVPAGKECGPVKNGGILVTLAPVPDKGDRVKVGLNGWQGCMAGTWQTYVVVPDGDGWRVKGTTGPVSIS